MDTLEGWDEQYPQAPIFKYISMVISNLNIERESELWKIIISVPAYAVLSRNNSSHNIGANIGANDIIYEQPLTFNSHDNQRQGRVTLKRV